MLHYSQGSGQCCAALLNDFKKSCRQIPKHDPLCSAPSDYGCKASQETLLWSSISREGPRRRAGWDATRQQADCISSLARHAQSFLALLALAMFSCRLCFFFCSRSLASIILASFHDNKALAMKRGVKARMTVVRKPYGSLAAHSTTYSAQARISIIVIAEVFSKDQSQPSGKA